MFWIGIIWNSKPSLKAWLVTEMHEHRKTKKTEKLKTRKKTYLAGQKSMPENQRNEKLELINWFVSLIRSGL